MYTQTKVSFVYVIKTVRGFIDEIIWGTGCDYYG